MASRINSRSKPPRPLIEPLEARVLYSADPFGLGLDSTDPSSIVELPLPDSDTTEPIANDVIFVDKSVINHQLLIDEIIERQPADRTLTIHTINATQSLEDVGEFLVNQEEISSLHIITHGSDTSIQIGQSTINSTTIDDYGPDLSRWRGSIDADGDILFYGCNLAATEDGQLLLGKIADLTGADIAASDDLTGHHSLGADWELEYAVGEILQDSLLLSDGVESWESILATIAVTTERDTVDAPDLTSVASLLNNPGADDEISLREAIIAANADPSLDVIVLPAGKYHLDAEDNPTDELTGDLDISSSIHLQGSDIGDTTIDAKNLDRVMSFTGGSSTLQNIKIQNGKTVEIGGGILLENATLTLRQIDLHNNDSSFEPGGGIYVDSNSSLNIHDSILRKNTAGKSLPELKPGGAIFNQQGAVWISRTEITENEGSDGGAVFNAGELTMFDTMLFKNHAMQSGGGIHNEDRTAIYRSLLVENKATTGAGIANSGSTLIQDTTVSKNDAINAGGGLSNTDGNTNLYRLTFAYNSADEHGAINVDNGTVNMQGSIVDNTITNNGGDVDAAVTSLGFNLLDTSLANPATTDIPDTNPRIENFLSNNGGFTAVHALHSYSPAINAGASTRVEAGALPILDSTGAARNELADIGAHEFRQPTHRGELIWSDPLEQTIFHGDTNGDSFQPLISNLEDYPVDVAVDTLNSRIYWVETEEIPLSLQRGYGSLWTANIDGSDPEPLQTELAHPTGLALDTANGRLLVTRDSTDLNDGTGENAIDAYTLDGTLIGPIVTGNENTDPPPDRMVAPTDVALNPLNQQPIWTDLDPSNFGIQTIDNVGNTVTVLETTTAPYGLAIGPEASSFFWAAANDNKVYRNSLLDGTRLSSSGMLGSIFGVTYHEPNNTVYTGSISPGRIFALTDDLQTSTILYNNVGYPTGITSASLSPISDGPTVEINDGATVIENGTIAITQKHLATADPNSTPDDLIYTINNAFPAHGELLLDGQAIPTTSTATFTQADVNAGKLQYRHLGDQITKDSFNFTVSDGSGPSTEHSFEITAIMVNDAPEVNSLETMPLAYTENDPPTTISNSLTITDSDSTNLESAAITIDGNYRVNEDVLSLSDATSLGSFWDANSGTLTLTGTESISNYQAAIRSVTYQNTSDAPDDAPRNVSITLFDGEDWSTAHSRAIDVTASYDAPMLSGLESSEVTYIEGAGAKDISNTLLLSDQDSTTIDSATITISSGYQISDDTLGITNTDTIKGFWDPTTGTLNVVGRASIADYQSAMQTVTYTNSSQNPNTSTRTVSFSIYDGNLTSNTLTRNITLSSINNDPVVGPTNPVTYMENAAPVLIAPSTTVTDPDTFNFDGGELKVSLSSESGPQGQLAIKSIGNGSGEVYLAGDDILFGGISHGTVTGVYNELPLIVTFNSNATSQSVEAILQHVNYENLSDNPQPTLAFSLELTDGDGGRTSVDENIAITPTNDAPVVTNLDGASIQVTNDGSHHPLDAGRKSLIFDPDDPVNLDGGSLEISGAQFAENDSLTIDTSGLVSLSSGYTNNSQLSVAGTVIGTITGVSSSGFTLSFNTDAITTRIDTLVQSILFSSTSENPSVRSVTLAISDGIGNGESNTSIATVNIFLNSSGGGIISVEEDSAHTYVTSDFSFTGTTADQLDSISIISLPDNGTLKIGTANVALNSTISRADIDSGLLVFEPEHNATGAPYSSFEFHTNSGNNTVNVLAGVHSSFSIDSNYHKSAAAILTNPENFGPAGIVTTDLSIQNSTSTIYSEYLAMGKVYFGGFVADNKISPQELQLLDSWIQDGGILISTSDSPRFDDINSYFGLTTVGATGHSSYIIDANHPIINGKFGLVGNSGDTFQGHGTKTGSFEESSLAASDHIIARNSSSDQPTLVLREHGNGHIIFTSDVGFFRASMTGNGVVTTANDKLTANIYAWAVDAVPHSTSHTMSINVTAVNDKPVLSSTTQTALPYLEGNGAVAVSPDITVEDVDNSVLSAAVVTFTDGYLDTEDRLTFTNSSSITGEWVSSTGTLALTGTDSSANYQAALQSVSYENTSNHPDTGTRKLTINVSDGTETSNTLVKDVTVQRTNDAPELDHAGSMSLTASLEDLASPSGNNVKDIILSAGGDRITDQDQGDLEGIALISASTENGHWQYQTEAGTGWINADSVSESHALLLNPESILRFLPHTNFYGTSPAIEFRAQDQTTAHSAGSYTSTVNNGGTTAFSRNTETATISILPVNDTPIVSSIENYRLTFDENGAPIPLTATLTVADIDNPSLQSATLKFTNGYTEFSDTLSFLDTDNIRASWDSSSGTLILSGIDTVEAYQAAIRSITYVYLGDNPDNATRDIAVTVNDGAAESVKQTRTVGITAHNDAPILTSLESSSLRFTENSPAIPITQTLVVSDADHIALASATVQIATGYQQQEDLLVFDNTDSISANLDTATGTLTLTGHASVSEYENALREVTYRNSSDNPHTNSRTLVITLSDGAAESVAVTRNIDIVANNDNPNIGTIEAEPLVYLENQGPMVISSEISLSDLDNTELGTAYITITSGNDPGEDILEFIDQSNITSHYDSAFGKLTLTGVDTVEAYQQALRSVTYSNHSDSPNTAPRVITFTVLDEQSASNSVTRSIKLVAVNDAPTAADNTIFITEDTPYTLDASEFGFIDAADGNSLSEVTYSTADAGRVSGTIDTGIVYTPAENDEGPATHHFNFVVVDDGGTDHGGTNTSTNPNTIHLHMVPVNDAPTLSMISLAATPEDGNQIPGESVQNLLRNHFFDIDRNDSLAGIAISANNAPAETGTWQFLVDDDASWQNIGQVSTDRALGLQATTYLRFLPAENFHGNPEPLTIHAMDTSNTDQLTNANAHSYVNAQNSGGSFPLSTETTLSTSIFSINDAPSASNATLKPVIEDTNTSRGASVEELFQSTYHDVDGADTIAGIIIIDNPSSDQGRWQYSSDHAKWLEIGTVSRSEALAVSHSTALRFIPAPDYFGTPSPLTALVLDSNYSGAYTSQDNRVTLDSVNHIDVNMVSHATITLSTTVLPANDAPVGHNITKTILEDQPYVFHAIDFGFSDPIEGHTFEHLTITAVPDSGNVKLSDTPVATGTTIDYASLESGLLSYTPATDANGEDAARLSFTVGDSGGTDNGGDDTDLYSKTFSFNIIAINDAPSGTNFRLNAVEDTAFQFATTDFGFSDASDGHQLKAIELVTSPTVGALTLKGQEVSEGARIATADINAGLLHYIAPPSANGGNFTFFEFRTIDIGGTLNGGQNTALDSNTISIDITAVDTSPTGLDASLTVLEDTPYTLTTAAFSYTDLDADHRLTAVVITAPPENGTLKLAGNRVEANQKIVVSDIEVGALVFEPATNTHGDSYAYIKFQVIDNGDETNASNIDLTPATLTINVFPINDPPENVMLSASNIDENSAAASVGSITVVDNDLNHEPGDTHTLSLSDARFEIVDGTLKLRDDITLDFETEPTIDILVTVTDSQGAQFEQPITLHVQNVNEAPILENAAQAQSGMPPYSFKLPGDTFFDVDGDTLDYSISQTNGEPLPDWLTFDKTTVTFTVAAVEPDQTIQQGTASILVTAMDAEGETAILAFDITREPAIAATEIPPPTSPAATPIKAEPQAAESRVDTNVTETQENNAPIQPQLENLLPEPALDQQEEATATLAIVENTQTSTLQNLPFEPTRYVTARTEPTASLLADGPASGQRTADSVATERAFNQLANQMDKSKNAVSANSEYKQLLIGSSVTLSSGLSIGYILWLVRGGTLVASMLTSLPAWRFMDPLPVLGTMHGDLENEDTESLETMVQEQSSSTDQDVQHEKTKSSR